MLQVVVGVNQRLAMLPLPRLTERVQQRCRRRCKVVHVPRHDRQPRDQRRRGQESIDDMEMRAALGSRGRERAPSLGHDVGHRQDARTVSAAQCPVVGRDALTLLSRSEAVDALPELAEREDAEKRALPPANPRTTR